MSGWKIAVQELADLGGTGKVPDLLHCGGEDLLRAQRLGLVKSTGRSQNNFADWSLTDLGRDYVSGRLEQITSPPKREGVRGSKIFAATWLKALPASNEIRL